jgi:hypothetical protein
MELRSCYFCGVAGRTVQSRPVSGVEVTLCPRCEEKLARLRTATDGDIDTTAATPVTFDTPASGPEESDAPATTSEQRDSATEPSPGDGDDPDESTEAGDGDDSGESTEAGDGDDPDESTEAGDGDAPDESTEAGDDANDGSGDDDSSGLRGLTAADRGSRSTYRKALRLLRNREFPMARSDTVDLLSSAYGLDREECDRLLDLCVDRGLLAEENGELKEP